MIKIKIEQSVNKINARKFDHENLIVLYSLVRQLSKNGSITREIGDNIGHPDERNRGLCQVEVFRLYNQLRDGMVLNGSQRKLANKISIRPIFSARDAFDDLNITLKIIDKSLFINDTKEIVLEYSACLLAILQGVQLRLREPKDPDDNFYKSETRLGVTPTGTIGLYVSAPVEEMGFKVNWEIINSDVKFIAQSHDQYGHGWFEGLLFPKRTPDGSLEYYQVVTLKPII